MNRELNCIFFQIDCTDFLMKLACPYPKILKELIDGRYVEMLHTKGRYIVTAKGYEVLKKLSLSSS